MILLYISCVLQYVLDKNAIVAEQMPPKLLEMSLKHVNTLLADIGHKIVHERELLSQIEVEKEKQVTRQNRLNPVPSDKEAARKLIQLWKISRAGGVVPELEKDPFDDAEFTTPITTTKGVNIFDNTDSKQTMLLFMKRQNVSYCLGAVHRALQALYEKTDDEIEIFFDALTTSLWGQADKGELDCLGPLLRNRIMRLSIWAKVIAPLYIKRFMRRVFNALDKRYFVDNDAEKAILTYDGLFTDEEGDQLLDSVVIIEAYDIIARGKDQTTKICENFINKFIAPVNRLCGTFFLKTVINDINMAYSTQYPLSERSAPKSIMDSLIESKSVSTTVLHQPICKKYKHIKCDYRRNILHLFIKFPTIFQEFVKHYRNSEERKHNHSKRKTCSSQRSTNHNIDRNKISERIYNRIFSQKIPKKKTEKYSKINFSVQSTALNTQNKIQSRFHNMLKPITGVNNSSLDILIPSFTESSLKNDTGNYTIRFEKNNITQFNKKITQSFYSTKQVRNKAVLDKIIGESSYSDEEMYLQVMLKDALFHGNNHWSG